MPGRAPLSPAPPWVAVAGARPNFVKLAPLVRAARAAGRDLPWIHTGQHPSAALARSLWREAGLPDPVASTRHVPPGPRRAERMAAALRAPLARLGPGLVVVVGDVDSTLAGALAAREAGLPLAHVEAGLRSGDRSMPEERNRVRADRLSDLLHASEPAAVRNLRAEGVPRASIRLDGHVLADHLAWALPRRREPGPAALRRLLGRPFGLVTLHRPSNVDEPARLEAWCKALAGAAALLPLVLPLHPRTALRLPPAARRGLRRAGVRLCAPLGPLTLLRLLGEARVVLTDSGGLALESAMLGRPCLVLRPRFEHRLALETGRVRLVGGDPRRLGAALRAVLALPPPAPPRTTPTEWDGQASARIVAGWASRLPGRVRITSL